MTPFDLIILLGGIAALLTMFKLFGPAPRVGPASVALDRVVAARVVEPSPLTADQMLAQLDQKIKAEGTALAFSTATRLMIEAHAKAVQPTWTPPAAPVSDHPKA